MSNLIDRVASWIQNYADQAGLASLVVGVSGGLDSAVVTRLCQRTNKLVVCVAMPMSLHADSNTKALQYAQLLCVGHDVCFNIVPIGDIVDSYIKFGVANHPVYNKLREGNLRARVRANILYDYAAASNGIVVGTGNKDEDEIGYFTKGGDGLVDICPLSKLHKSQVREMAKELKVPECIIKAQPTAGLWEGQTDENELGMTYDEVEWALKLLESGNAGLYNTREATVLEKVVKLKDRNAHKLAYPPIFDPEVD